MHRLFLLLAFLLTSYSLDLPVLFGQSIIDLYQSSTPSSQEKLASKWEIVNQASISTTFSCNWGGLVYGDPSLSASPGAYFQRIYTNLGSHQSLRFYFSTFLVGMPTASDKLTITVDSEVYFISLAPTSNPSASFDCSSQMAAFFVVGQLDHTATDLTLKITPGLLNAYIGIKDVVILLADSSLTSSSPPCIQLDSNPIFIPTGKCTCQYMNTYGSSCADCTSACRGCFQSADICYTCGDNHAWSGTSCASVPTNNNCKFYVPNTQQCIYCSNNYYLTTDYTCVDTCPTPYVGTGSEDYFICQKPCEGDSTKPYYSQTTGECGTCELPYKVDSISKDYPICRKPCESDDSYPLYSTASQTCVSSCQAPYKEITTGDYPICQEPCESDPSKPYYFIEDDTCKATCSSPAEIKTVNGYLVCVRPCQSDSAKPYYLVEDKVCVSSCEYPNTVENGYVCDLGLSADDIESLESKVSLQKTVSEVLGGVAVFATLLSFSDPGASSMVNMLKLLPYMKFMKVAFPPRLYLLLSMQKADQGSTKFVPAPSEEIMGGFDYHEIPYRFAKYKLHSSFLVNFWSYFMTLLIILGGVLIVFLLDYFTKDLKGINSVTKSAKQAVKWNFSIMFFLGYFDLLIIYTSLEFRTLHLDSFLSSLSFVICIAINLAALVVIYKSIQVIIALQKSRKLVLEFERENNANGQGLNQYEILYKVSKDAAYSQHLFMAVFIIRTYLFSLIIGYLFDHPLAQAILIIILNLAMLFYLILNTPLKLKIKLAQFIVQEIMMFSVNLCVLILASLDEAGSVSASFRAVIGDIIIMLNLIFNFLATVFVVLVGLFSAYQAYKESKNKKLPGNLNPLEASNQHHFATESLNLGHSELKIEKPQRDRFMSNDLHNFDGTTIENTRKNSSIIMNGYDSSPQTRPLDFSNCQESEQSPGGFQNSQVGLYHPNMVSRDNSFNMLNQSQLSVNYGEVLPDYANRKRSDSAYPLATGQIGMNTGIGGYQDPQESIRRGYAKGMYSREARQLRRNFKSQK